jgi:hypothetical protein
VPHGGAQSIECDDLPFENFYSVGTIYSMSLFNFVQGRNMLAESLEE